MSDLIEHFFLFSPPAAQPEAGLRLSGDHATLHIPPVSSFTELVQVYGEGLGQEGYFGNSLDSFQDCLKDSKSFWSIQPATLEVVHQALPNLPESHLEAYISMLIQMVIRYSTHAQHNEQLDPQQLREELRQNFPSMSEAQVEFYISPIPTTTFRVHFPAHTRGVLQQVLEGLQHDVQHELTYWKSKGFTLPSRFTD
ncbi:barstar family protein [Deinococcus cellulosilyticus]|uniref:Barstar (barnase inhibitor) domain-containing protein n=1 Tax=Deinococcus cellulosilyticus (strain DSM 18568 / NBRC 106333 / KACC 11606 / 5516J-15) TaxID=1223518 RepID=A0A511N5F8_DEIC1|nr:hypothetical protein [Deinococcus cellulosilyticus]GEM48083.1 hypothetical protein DC3_37180 [Deinococcus cellulosilyticus NBRC 106333 = KACC 11606]